MEPPPVSNRRSLSWSSALRDLRGDRAARPEVREERLNTLSGGRIASGLILSAWRGRSGCRYVVAVFGLDRAVSEDLTDIVVLAVIRDAQGVGRILRATADIDGSDVAPWIDSVRRAGATEIHVHRLAETVTERHAVVIDLTVVRNVAGLGEAA
jgi:hypothetical protein